MAKRYDTNDPLSKPKIDLTDDVAPKPDPKIYTPGEPIIDDQYQKPDPLVTSTKSVLDNPIVTIKDDPEGDTVLDEPSLLGPRGKFTFDSKLEKLVQQDHKEPEPVEVSEPRADEDIDISKYQKGQQLIVGEDTRLSFKKGSRSSGEIRYGIISDIHKNPMVAHAAVQILTEKYNVDVFLGNGDLADPGRDPEESQKILEVVLDAFGRSGKESRIQPGSHEKAQVWESVVGEAKNRYSNIIDALEIPRREADDHHLVFIPGSDWVNGGEFKLEKNDDHGTGKYLRNMDELCEFTNWEHTNALQKARLSAPLYLINMEDIQGRVTDPDKTIVICHVPPKFDLEDRFEDAADYAHYWEVRKYSRDLQSWEDISYEAMSVLPADEIPQQAVKNQFGDGVFGLADSDAYIQKKIEEHFSKAISTSVDVIVERKGSRGNVDLASIYKELGITKGISGHFHESSHNAHTTDGSRVSQGQLTDDLWWNTGHLENGYCGVLTVKDGKVSYQNVDLRDYLPKDAQEQREHKDGSTILDASGKPYKGSDTPLIINPYDK